MTKVNKNLMTIIVGGIVASTAVLSITQANAFERGDRGSRGGQAFARMDVDLSGSLTLDEMLSPVLAKTENKFARKDSDESGEISFEEFSQTANGARPDLSLIADEIVQCVADIKAESGDESIVVPSADQFSSLADKFDAIDTTDNEAIDIDEALAKATSKVTAVFAAMDSDVDSLVSEEEYNASKAIRKATGRSIKICIDELSSDNIL